jgi:PEP-CTERM motif
MKTLLLATTLAAFATAALAQDGTFSGSNIIGGVRQYIYEEDWQTLLPKANGAVQFVYNGTVLGAGVYPFIANGLFSVGTINVPNMAGQSVDIEIDVWDKSTAATYKGALSNIGGHFLWPQTVYITLGGAGNPPATPAALVGFTGGHLLDLTVPEPSALALAALGLGGLFFLGRRR